MSVLKGPRGVTFQNTVFFENGDIFTDSILHKNDHDRLTVMH
jgi:hypothetical protein